MSQQKTAEFQVHDLELSYLMKSFAHPARVVILEELAKNKDMSCKELVAVLPLSQSTVSQHLSELLESGLICRKQKGNMSLYTVEWNKLERAFTLIGRLSLNLMNKRPKRNCC
jgi:DNA-binding transcriptional ArsR family regulator